MYDQYQNLKINCECKRTMVYGGSAFTCNSCGNSYGITNGVCMVDGDYSKQGRMDPEAYNKLVKFTEKHFWFNYRNDQIFSIINSTFKDTSKIKILDIGCGDANVIRYLSKRDLNAVGCDINSEGLMLSNLEVPLFHADVSTNLFSEKQFDVILLLDVIEHVPDDQILLKAAKRLLTDDGILIVMVPSGRYLWSTFDVISGHYRRYTKKELRASLKSSKYKIERITHFMSLILPIYLFRASYYRTRKIEKDEISDQALNLNPSLNTIFGKICQIERFLLNFLDLRMGASLLAITRKK